MGSAFSPMPRGRDPRMGMDQGPDPAGGDMSNVGGWGQGPSPSGPAGTPPMAAPGGYYGTAGQPGGGINLPPPGPPPSAGGPPGTGTPPAPGGFGVGPTNFQPPSPITPPAPGGAGMQTSGGPVPPGMGGGPRNFLPGGGMGGPPGMPPPGLPPGGAPPGVDPMTAQRMAMFRRMGGQPPQQQGFSPNPRGSYSPFAPMSPAYGRPQPQTQPTGGAPSPFGGGMTQRSGY